MTTPTPAPPIHSSQSIIIFAASHSRQITSQPVFCRFPCFVIPVAVAVVRRFFCVSLCCCFFRLWQSNYLSTVRLKERERETHKVKPNTTLRSLETLDSPLNTHTLSLFLSRLSRDSLLSSQRSLSRLSPLLSTVCLCLSFEALSVGFPSLSISLAISRSLLTYSLSRAGLPCC